MVIHILCTFHRFLCTCYLVTSEFDNFKLIACNNSYTTDEILTKIYVHGFAVLIHIKVHFHGFLIIGNLVIINFILWIFNQFKGRASYDLDDNMARAFCTCSRCGWGLFGHFYSSLTFLSFFSLSWETARYRQKYCFKAVEYS